MYDTELRGCNVYTFCELDDYSRKKKTKHAVTARSIKSMPHTLPRVGEKYFQKQRTQPFEY